MSVIHKKQFERQYGIDLLPVSSQEIQLGDIWDWEGLFRPKLVRLMNNVALLGNGDNHDLFYELGKVKTVNAAIPNIEMKDDKNIKAGVEVPSMNLNLSHDLSMDRVASFQFQDIVSREMSGIVKTKVIKHLDNLEHNHNEDYIREVKHNWVAVWLFYAESVVIEVDRGVENKGTIEAELQKVKGATLDVASTGHSTVRYTLIGNSGCPFAAQFIRGKHL